MTMENKLFEDVSSIKKGDFLCHVSFRGEKYVKGTSGLVVEKTLSRVIRLTQSLDIGQDFQKLSFQIIHGVTTVCHLFSSKHAWDELKKSYSPNDHFLKIFLDDPSPGRKYNSSHLQQIQVGRLAPEKPFRV